MSSSEAPIPWPPPSLQWLRGCQPWKWSWPLSVISHAVGECPLCFPLAWGCLLDLSLFSRSVVSWLWDAMDCSMPNFPVFHHLPELAQTHVHWVSHAIQPSHPLSSCSPPASVFPSIRVFSNGSALCLRWPKYWSFSLSLIGAVWSGYSLKGCGRLQVQSSIPSVFLTKWHNSYVCRIQLWVALSAATLNSLSLSFFWVIA